MIFTRFCVFIVMLIAIIAGTMTFDALIGDDDGYAGWVISTIGFALCLTMLLVNYGII